LNEYERLHAQAEILEKVLAWCVQPDVPTGRLGWVSATDLRMRAIALRTEADVMHAPQVPVITEEQAASLQRLKDVPTFVPPEGLLEFESNDEPLEDDHE
jgi:hypothetical protein